MRALVAVILNTLREALRQPFYYLLVAAGAAALVIMMWVPLFTLGSDTDMYKDLGLSFVLLFLLLAGLLAAATGIAREVEDRTAGTILAKAVGRWQFILGKYLGVMAAVGIAAAFLAVVFGACMYYRVALDAGVMERGYAGGGIGAEIEAFQARQFNQAITVLPGIVLVVLQVGVLAALATALSTRFSATTSVALGLGAFLVGHLTVFLEPAARSSGAVAGTLAQVVMTALPSLEAFNINQKLSHTVLTPMALSGPGGAEWLAVWSYVGWAAAYAVAYAAAMIALAVLLFRRRSLT
jgi:ABC-type transport system involved in multi-copper enzyme maturation permease subunit